MSGFSRGVADGMLLNSLASAESAASSAQRDAESARNELRRYRAWAEREIDSWRRLTEEIKGQRDGFQALLKGFYRAAKAEKTEGPQLDAHMGRAIAAARACLADSEDYPEKASKQVFASWADECMRAWNVFYCLVPMAAPAESPAAPLPPTGVETVKCKRFFIFPCTRYVVEGKEYKRRKRAVDAFLAASQHYYEVMVPKWQAAMKKHEAYVEAYETQQKNINSYGLNT